MKCAMKHLLNERNIKMKWKISTAKTWIMRCVTLVDWTKHNDGMKQNTQSDEIHSSLPHCIIGQKKTNITITSDTIYNVFELTLIYVLVMNRFKAVQHFAVLNCAEKTLDEIKMNINTQRCKPVSVELFYFFSSFRYTKNRFFAK